MATPPERSRSGRPGVDLGGVALGLVILVLVGIWIVGMINLQSTASGPMQLTYQELRRQVGEGNVATVVARGQEIDGTFRTAVDDPAADGASRTRFESRRPDFARDDLLAYLEANGVDVTAEAPAGGGTSALDVVRAMLPFILIIGLFMLLVRRPRGLSGGNFGRTRARRYEPDQDDIRFADVAGIEEAKGELLEVVDFLRDPEPYRRLGAAMPRGVLLYGPPGTGKTLLARAVAGEAGVPFFSLSASEFVEMFVGVGASRVRDLFAQAKEAAPAIVFIDELDAIGRVRMRGASPVANDEREQTLNQILAELDGFTGAEGVVVLAATNRPEILDPALLRAGRFDRRVSVNPPDRAGRQAILAVHTRGVPLDTDVDLATIAASTPGMVGADLRALVNEAALTAARHRHGRVGAIDFSDALERVLLGAERRIVITPEERARTAYHEAGHALLATLVPGAAVVRKVSIVPHGQALGVTLQSPDADRHGYTEEELRGRVVAALGGRAAEEVVFGQISTGAEDDLEQVARIVRQMVERWGMSRAVGPNAVLPAQDAGVLTPASGAVSEETRRLVDAEVRRIVDAAHEEALTLLRANRDRLEALAAELLERETLDESDVRRIAGPPAPRVSGPAGAPGPASAMGASPH
ncbi:MAG: ATP-dependent zinc metalloprotease FtsH [Thermoleophilia bacterium]